jgi:hypothetical protein
VNGRESHADFICDPLEVYMFDEESLEIDDG